MPFRFRALPLLVLALRFLLPHVASADDSSVERRFSELERRVEALERENAALRARLDPPPPAAPAPAEAVASAPAAAKKPSPRTEVEMSGLVQVQGEVGDGGDSRWDGAGDRVFLRRARIGIEAKFGEGFEAELEGDLSGGLAPSSGLRMRMTDGFVRWSRHSFLTVRAGQFKSPFGYEELTSDKKLFTPERAFPSEQLTLGRQVGVELAGALGKGAFGYAVAAFNGYGTNTTANPDERFLLVGRLTTSIPLPAIADQPSSIGFGASTYSSDDTAVGVPEELGFDSTPASAAADALFTGMRRGFEVDSQLRIGPFEVWGEYLRARFEPANELPAAVVEADGWSALLVWHAVPKRFSLVGRYETFDPRRARGDDDTRTFLLGTNWFLRGNELKLQLHWMRSETGDSGPSDKVIGRIQAVF